MMLIFVTHRQWIYGLGRAMAKGDFSAVYIHHKPLYLLAKIALQKLSCRGFDIASVVEFGASKLDLVFDSVVRHSCQGSLEAFRRVMGSTWRRLHD